MDIFLFHRNCTSQNHGMTGNCKAGSFVNHTVTALFTKAPVARTVSEERSGCQSNIHGVFTFFSYSLPRNSTQSNSKPWIRCDLSRSIIIRLPPLLRCHTCFARRGTMQEGKFLLHICGFAYKGCKLLKCLHKPTFQTTDDNEGSLLFGPTAIRPYCDSGVIVNSAITKPRSFKK